VPASLDLLLPVGAHPFDPEEPTLVRRAVEEALTDGLWVRDLPCVPAGDPDLGQGGDPFADLAHLSGAGLDEGVRTLGTASVILGLRHPLVVARGVVGVMARARCRVVLGIGTGGKPAMNEALGVADRTMAEFAEQWTRLREAVRGSGDEAMSRRTQLVTPDGYHPPDMHLATTDMRRWEAIEGDAEGWQTFLTVPEEYLAAWEDVMAITGGVPQVCVRADVTITSETGALVVGERGRVTCTVGQLVGLLRTWRQLPVDHLLLSLHGADPLATLRTVRENF
jgi:alkanesulfonate monooxygenase SsuD/methylene tetrahydromethanopterin reductase-like flavin-dependent oxidoreductase (luciferase family)